MWLAHGGSHMAGIVRARSPICTGILNKVHCLLISNLGPSSKEYGFTTSAGCRAACSRREVQYAASRKAACRCRGVGGRLFIWRARRLGAEVGAAMAPLSRGLAQFGRHHAAHGIAAWEATADACLGTHTSQLWCGRGAPRPRHSEEVGPMSATEEAAAAAEAAAAGEEMLSFEWAR